MDKAPGSQGAPVKLILEPYSPEMFEDAMQFAQAWGSTSSFSRAATTGS